MTGLCERQLGSLRRRITPVDLGLHGPDRGLIVAGVQPETASRALRLQQSVPTFPGPQGVDPDPHPTREIADLHKLVLGALRRVDGDPPHGQCSRSVSLDDVSTVCLEYVQVSNATRRTTEGVRMVQGAPHIGAGDNFATLAALYDAHGACATGWPITSSANAAGEQHRLRRLPRIVEGCRRLRPEARVGAGLAARLTHRRAVEWSAELGSVRAPVGTSGADVALPWSQHRAARGRRVGLFGGRTQSEIAEHTGLELSAVKSRTLGALRQMQLSRSRREGGANRGHVSC